MSNIPNIGKFPAPGLHWGKALITKNTKAISKKMPKLRVLLSHNWYMATLQADLC